MNDDDPSILARLQDSEALAEAPHLAPVAAGIFDHAQYLLDDDDNLTRAGNLTGEAKQRLRERALELLGVAEADVDA